MVSDLMCIDLRSTRLHLEGERKGKESHGFDASFIPVSGSVLVAEVFDS